VITWHLIPIAQLAPAERRNADAVRDMLGRLKAGREALAHRGFRLASLPGPGDGLRDLAHKGHRY
jgi:antitoxin (DNA-binding transcriptional repressor) of toxin-antitoxin stability system